MDLMKKNNIKNNNKNIWFAQLYGMSDQISFNIANLGYNVCKLLPYGPVNEVIPYLIRRAEENSSVRGQSSRELDLIKRNLKGVELIHKYLSLHNFRTIFCIYDNFFKLVYSF